MKQQNYLFVDIISSFFLLLILIGNFMGLLYISDGNIALSLLGSLVLVICYYFAVEQLQKNKEAMYKKNFLHPSMIFWLFFFVLSYVSFNLTTHFINVEYNCKNQIKAEANAKLNLVDSLVLVYKKRANEDIQNYDAKLDSMLQTYKKDSNSALRNQLAAPPYNVAERDLNNISFLNPKQVANAKVTPFAIKSETNIKNIDKTISNARPQFQSVFDNWKRFSLVETYAKLNQYVVDNLAFINAKIAELPLNKSQIPKPDFQKQLPLNSPSALAIIYKPNYWTPTIFVMLTHIFLLIPFWTKKVRIHHDFIFEKIRRFFAGKEITSVSDPLEIENVREI
jgi:hypothetical protein